MKRALIVVDVQKGFAEWDIKGARNNPDCERNVAKLIEGWREAKQPIVFVRHDSVMEKSVLRPGQPGNDFKDVVSGEPDLLVTKSVNSAFYGQPDLHQWLEDSGISDIAICGIQTNLCCETTARMAGNLGLDTWFVLDATHTFAKTYRGKTISAEELSEITAANLAGEFADVITTSDALARLFQVGGN
ncbi:MAG: cysteine hydrolase family protein [Rhodoluna sp.]